jgi:hypothetical protein
MANGEELQAVKEATVTAPLEPQEVAKQYGSTMDIYFDKDVTLTAEWGKAIAYTRGVHAVPTQFYDQYKWFFDGHNAQVRQTSVVVKQPVKN